VCIVLAFLAGLTALGSRVFGLRIPCVRVIAEGDGDLQLSNCLRRREAAAPPRGSRGPLRRRVACIDRESWLTSTPINLIAAQRLFHRPVVQQRHMRMRMGSHVDECQAGPGTRRGTRRKCSCQAGRLACALPSQRSHRSEAVSSRSRCRTQATGPSSGSFRGLPSDAQPVYRSLTRFQ